MQYIPTPKAPKVGEKVEQTPAGSLPTHQPEDQEMGSMLTLSKDFKGSVTDMNGAVIPEEKEAIQANLKKANDATLERFGLEQRGMDELK